MKRPEIVKSIQNALHKVAPGIKAHPINLGD